MLKNIVSNSQRNWKNVLLGRNDLPSMAEIVGSHVQMLNISEGKYMKTTDKTTLSIAQKILEDNEFLKTNILSCPGTNLTQTGSLKVTLCDINNHPDIKNKYLEWAAKGRKRVIAIGGPSASDQTLISSLIQNIRQTHDVHFYCRNYLETNVLHSANQSHARHGNALNADPVLSGRHLIPLIFKRMFFATSVDDVTKADYIKVDVKLNNFKYLVEYVKNQINGLKQIMKSWFGKTNQHDINRLESLVSQQIQKVMQKSTNSVFTTNNGKNIADSMAIHLIFSGDSLDEIHAEQAQFSRVKELKWQELPKAQIKQLFPQSNKIMTAYRYLGDYSNKFDMYEMEKQKATQLGATWNENKTISKVYLDKDANGNPITCGIEFTDGEFVPADKVHLTLGYKGDYVYQGSENRALNSINIPATGVSTTFLFKKTPQLKNIIQNKGSLELAIINSHWTIIGHDQEHVLMRATAGGNTGTQSYMPSHFINLCTNTRNVFGDAFIGIVSVYGCVRAINYKNSTQFAKLAEGLVVSYGKGGTGNTKRASQAYKALKYLGLGKELEQYFNSFSDYRLNIVNNINKITEQSKKNNFYYDNTAKTSKALFKAYL